MRILLTGGNGFLGKILTESLSKSHQVITLGRGPENELPIDISESNFTLPEVEMIIHAAGKAHVIPKTELEKEDFFNVNERGTLHLIQGISHLPKIFIFISTVAVYGLEEGEHITEEYPLRGNTPYAKSKINAENLLQIWAEENGVKLLILRLPLIVANHAPGNLGAIVSAIKKGFYFRLGDGDARKSMVLAEDLAAAIPNWEAVSGTYNLTDGADPKLSELDTWIASKFGKTVRQVPLAPLRAIAKIGDYVSVFPLNTYRLNKLKHQVTFSDAKARKELGWNPKPVVGNFNPH